MITPTHNTEDPPFYMQPPDVTETSWRSFDFEFKECRTFENSTICSLTVTNTQNAKKLHINEVDDIKIYDNQGIYHQVLVVVFGSAEWPNDSDFFPGILTNEMPRDVGVTILIGIARVTESVEWLSIDINFSEDPFGKKTLLPIRKAFLRADIHKLPPDLD